MNHPLLRHFLLGHAHANSAPPSFGLNDIEFDSQYVASELTPDAIEIEMQDVTGCAFRQVNAEKFWYEIGRLSDEGYTLKGPDDTDLLCFQYLEETL